MAAGGGEEKRDYRVARDPAIHPGQRQREYLFAPDFVRRLRRGRGERREDVIETATARQREKETRKGRERALRPGLPSE
jgi:hypothetical protein